MTIQSTLDAQYAKIAVACGKMHDADKPAKRRRALLAAINNHPERVRITSAYEGFCSCFPRANMRMVLACVEPVINKKLRK